MRALKYLLVRNTIGMIKRLIRKPLNLVFAIFTLLYIIFMSFILAFFFLETDLNNPEGFILIATLITLYIHPMNYVSYARRKGIAFKQMDVNFVFTAPVNPKLPLVYATTKSILISLLIEAAVLIYGITVFEISIPRMIIYFLVAFVAQNILEISIVILLYANPNLSERQKKIFGAGIISLVILLFGIGVYVFLSEGLSLDSICEYLMSDAILMVPILGWYIALIRLIVLEPTTVNIICSILYILSTIGLSIYAWKMECYGEYYEDAMKFADDYSKAVERGKKGQISFNRKGKKYKSA